jgi:hypothetical protein
MDTVVVNRSRLVGRRALRSISVAALAPLVIGLVACSSSSDAAVGRSYPLWSDGWRFGDLVLLAGDAGPFHARLTERGACAWLGSADRVEPTRWPSGWRVRLHPSALLDDRGVVVAHEGDVLSVAGGTRISTGKSPRCGGPGEEIWDIEGPVKHASTSR